jgi:hypothetical protein
MVTRTNQKTELGQGVGQDLGQDQNLPGTGEHVESLDSIAALGTQLETPTVAPAQQAQNEAQDVAEIAMALELLRAAALPFAPEHVQEPLLLIWSDSQLKKVAAAIVELCKFHGWTVGDFFSEYGPYIQLAMALGMPLLATLKLLKTPPPAQHNGQQQPA